MAEVLDAIDDHPAAWIARRPLFVGADGHTRTKRENGSHSIDGLPALASLQFPVSE